MELCIKFDFFSEGRQVVTCNLMYICIDVNPGQDHLTKVHDSGMNMYDICMTYMNLKCSKKCPSSTDPPSFVLKGMLNGTRFFVQKFGAPFLC